MLKDMSAGVNRLLTGLRFRPGVRRVNLALQGGGAHGAFTWGVLDYLLEDGRLVFSGVSGASAGAVNAVMLADGLARGGPVEARKRLAEFWRAASLGGALPGPQRAVLDRVLALFPVGGSPVQLFVDAMSRLMSPYDFNPLNINPLKDLIGRFVDFEAIRAYAEMELFISATNVHSGRLRVFRREDISADVVMASAALPHVFRAVEIDGEPYWDGGFTGNPAILPLVASNADDVLLVQIAPLKRDDTPTSARDILNRVNEISFSSSLAAELRALEYVGRGTRHAPAVNVHRILLEGLDKRLNGSRLKTDYDFFSLLHRAGRRAARRFLDRHFADIGHRSTLDLVKETAA
ncbi:MAG: patatin-like phospholipase family protein [Pseudorhodoplanes sp.]|uniref:patatin-like phospholipase family protein n=1 Tax=Pseudorhodoplanes sp. TaxID=1934341 RepID=UPI003D1323EB